MSFRCRSMEIATICTLALPLPCKEQACSCSIVIRSGACASQSRQHYCSSACGGGGGGGEGDTSSASAIVTPRPVEQTDLQIAAAIYAGTSRTPAEFLLRDRAEWARGGREDSCEEHGHRSLARRHAAAIRALYGRLESSVRVVRNERSQRRAVFRLSSRPTTTLAISNSVVSAQDRRNSTCSREFTSAHTWNVTLLICERDGRCRKTQHSTTDCR